MSRFISNVPIYVPGYKYGLIEVSRYAMIEAVNRRPGYDMNCVRTHLYDISKADVIAIPGYSYREIENWIHEMIETEREFDKLSIVKPGQTLTSWAINVRIPLQELWAKKGKLSVYHQYCLFAEKGEIVNSRNCRPKIHKSCMAICFYCWKLVKINDKRGCIKAVDLLKNHWDLSCKIPITRDGSAHIIQMAYRNYRKRSTSFIKKVWEEVRNDDTSKEKKFLGMPHIDEIRSIKLAYLRYPPLYYL
jgi:hypothetical protein